uniref:DUF488 domain-containing protein n=1 Tax=Candidatus Kentrum eta TaxID=2126337 RepID=A0A450UIY6_9GAMM|nr:MAG: Protein of unknown function, DUF488 [Candidatus Kentron sp. H]VFJ92467.1 MAG: Protein of unknown function, DUF488 [Candidatus Kentron sp. H]VFJ99238.1 MAG: Protein of unknown function, DUF488 [Candidatus Kentron sp. H]
MAGQWESRAWPAPTRDALSVGSGPCPRLGQPMASHVYSSPTKDILDTYKKKLITWDAYEDKFLDLMSQRNIERSIDQSLLDNGCLLCSEHEPNHCHRRLVVEYLNRHWNTDIKVVHFI